MYSRWLPYDCRERAWNDGYYGKFPSAVIFNSCSVFILIYLQTQGRFTEKDLPGLHFNLSTALEAKTPTPIHPLHSFNLKRLFFIPNTWEVEWMWGTDNASSIRTRGRKGWEEKRVTDHKRGTWQKYGLFFLDCLNISTKHSCIVVLLCPWKSEYGATNRLYLW